MSRFCFTCERERTREFACRICSERECAICGDTAAALCGTCSYEVQSARELSDVIPLFPEGTIGRSAGRSGDS